MSSPVEHYFADQREAKTQGWRKADKCHQIVHGGSH